MFNALKSYFDQRIASFVETPEAQHSLELAGAALLMEISRADHDVSPPEQRAMRVAMKKVFHLASDEIDDLIATAENVVDSAVSLHDFTAVINESFKPGQKLRLIEMLWDVAYADGHLDRYEEYYIRKIADLLHVPHRAFINAKLKAAPPARD
jgi:uncharacterized tellurite resistance protein B-like protein